jgi:hypothetical protein
VRRDLQKLLEKAMAMNDTAKSAGDRTPGLPIGPWKPKVAPSESADYDSAVSEGWPASPDPREPEPWET